MINFSVDTDKQYGIRDTYREKLQSLVNDYSMPNICAVQTFKTQVLNGQSISINTITTYYYGAFLSINPHKSRSLIIDNDRQAQN